MIFEQVQNILNGGVQTLQKSDFSNYALSEQVKCVLNKSYISQETTVEKSLLSAESIQKAKPAGRNWGQLIPVRKMNAAGRMVTYWESPEDRNEGKMKGAQNLFDIDELDAPASDNDYYGQWDKDAEEYQIKPLIMKFSEYNPALAKRMEECGLNKEESDNKISLALEKVGLASLGNKKPNQLSGGQAQRVAIARAIVNDPSIILADEPTGNLDSYSSIEIMGIFQRLNREKGISIVLITHEPDIAEYTDRMVKIVDGQIVHDAYNNNVLLASEEIKKHKRPGTEVVDEEAK